MRVTWIGHATVLVQTAGLKHPHRSDLVDTRLPFPSIGPERVARPASVSRPAEDRSRPRQPQSLRPYGPADAEALVAAGPAAIVTSLGNDTILRNVGIEAVALDWGGSLANIGAEVVVVRNHHWGSRWGTDRNRALWSAFVVKTPAGDIFYAGDTGWGDGGWVHEAAARGPYRLAIIPIGAYEPRDFMKPTTSIPKRPSESSRC
jgi:L-ascorbate metabolism protein UlaG (beta-lactamase superfamily)